MDGCPACKTTLELVAYLGPLDPVPQEDAKVESAGLTGFVVVNVTHQRVSGPYMHRRAAEVLGDDDERVIDLSKVPASAIVKPEPERIRLWINVHRNHEGLIYVIDHGSREVADKDREQRIACIPVEFEIGEGLPKSE